MKVIRLEAERPAERKQTIRGVEFVVAISPFFFPERLECEYDEEQGSLVINFRYLDTEPLADKPLSKDELITLWAGKHTGRLLSVHVAVDQHNLDRVLMLVQDEIPKAIEEARNARPEAAENFDAAEEAIRQNKEEIAELAMA